MTLLDEPLPLSPAVQRARLANLLRSHRRARRASVGSLARHSSTFRSADLRAYERGERDFDEATATQLAELYGVDLDLIAPPRTLVEVDLDHGRVAAAGVVRPIAADDALGAYLELVYELRGERGEIPLRDDDVHVLATTLDLDADDVEDRLCELMKVSRSDARRLLGSLAIGLPAGAAVAGLIVVGSLALRGPVDDPTPPASGSASSAPVTTLVVDAPDPGATVDPGSTVVTSPAPEVASDPTAPAPVAPRVSNPPAVGDEPAPVDVGTTPPPQVEVPDPVVVVPPPILIGPPPIDIDPEPGSGPPRVESPPAPQPPDPEVVAPG